MALDNRQRRRLKSLAHSLDPTVRIGKAQVTDAVADETERSLEAHELIKVRIEAGTADERTGLAETLANRTQSELVGSVGKIAILYRPREANPKIRL